MDLGKVKRLIWAKEVKKDFFRITDFTFESWGNQVVLQFREDMRRAVQRISQFPNIHPRLEEVDNIPKCVINRHVVMYYQYLDSEIYILRIYPTKMKPLDFEATA